MILNFNKADQPATEKWELINNSDGIATYVRWVKVNNELSVRERKAEFIIQSEIHEIVQAITQPEFVKLWMNNVTENKILKRVNENEFYTYTLFDLPWPFSNRDLISCYSIRYNNTSKTVDIVIESKENMYKTKEGITRIEKYKAKWFIKQSGKKAQIEFRAITYTKPEMPRYIQDPVMQKTFHQNLLNLKNFLETIKK